MRTVVSGQSVNPSIVVRSSAGTALCEFTGRNTRTCPLPVAGTYDVAVAVSSPAETFTTIDSVQHPGDCGSTLDVAVGGLPAALDVTQPGGARCLQLPSPAGAVLDLAIDGAVNPMSFVVYNAAGDHQCSGNIYRGSRTTCALSSGSAFRVFAELPETQTDAWSLFATQLSRPSGCVAGVVDDYGQAPSRRGSLESAAMACTTVTTTGARKLLVHEILTGQSGTIGWRLLSPAAVEYCAGRTGHSLTQCPVPSAGTYNLFTYRTSTGSDVPAYALSVTDIAASGGCAALPAAWGQDPAATSIATPAEVVCHSFTASPGDTVRVPVGVPGGEPVSGVLANASGTVMCSLWASRNDCTLSGAGPYRILLGSRNAMPAALTVNVGNMRNTTGCAEATPLAFGSGGGLSDAITAPLVTDCFAVVLPAGADVLLRTTNRGGTLRSQWEVWSPSGALVCGGHTAATACRLPATAGTYLVLVSSLYNQHVENQIGDYGFAMWRLDPPTGCAPVTAAFDHPEQLGTLGDDLQVDCRELVATTITDIRVRSATTESGNLRHFVVNASGTIVCNTWDDGDCAVSGSAPYRVLSYSDSGVVTDYAVSVGATNTPSGCAVAPRLAFGDSPSTPVVLSGRADLACIVVDRPSATGRAWVHVVSHDPPGTTVSLAAYRANGDRVCTNSGSHLDCDLSGSGRFALVLHASGPVTATLGWWDLTQTTGCGDAGLLAFGEAPVEGRIEQRGEVDCTTVSGRAGGVVRFLLAKQDPGANVYGVVVDGAGATLCEFTGGYQTGQDCRLAGIAPYRVLTYVAWGNVTTSDYAVRGWQLYDPAGCTQISSVAVGFGPLQADLADSSDQHCYQFAGSAGDTFNVTGQNLDLPAKTPMTQLVRPDGTVECSAQPTFTGCVLQRSGRYALVVSRSWGMLDFDGRYKITGTCTNPACGPEEYAVIGLSPTSAGASANVTLELRGRALSMRNTVALRRAGVPDVAAVTVAAAPDGRALTVRLDLSGSAPGAYDVVVAAPDTSTITIPGAFTVQGVVAPHVEVSLVGRARFVPGRTQTITIEYENTGNVDALGVPVFVHGLPLGTTVTPMFDVKHFDPASRQYTNQPWNQAKSVYRVGNALEMVWIVGRVPGRAKGTLQFQVSVPAQIDYTLAVAGGTCFAGAPATTLAATLQGPRIAAAPIPGFDGHDCAGALLGIAANFIPGAACVDFAVGLGSTAVTDAVSGDIPFTAMDGVDLLATSLGGAACVASVVPGGQIVSGVLGALGDGVGAFKSGWDAGGACSDDVENLAQSWIASMDPNEIVGPAGGGPKHAVQGKEAHTYAIYFENMSTATAPAQEVRIVDRLDPTVFDLSTLTFGRVSWGAHSFAPQPGATSIDGEVDLRPKSDLKVAVRASAALTGEVRWEIQSIDPATGRLPEDPEAGFLPPNNPADDGQGVVYFTVGLLAPRHGDVITNKAQIVFDLNPPIETNTWSNLVDTIPPTSKVAALPVVQSSPSISPTWSGSDAGSGIAGYNVYVSTDGGDYVPWLVGTTATTGVYQGATGHTYAFTVVSYDFAGHVESFPVAPDATIKVGPTTVMVATAPVRSGTARVGGKLTVSGGTWTPVPTARSYQWKRSGTPISGATKATYVPVAADLGKPVTVTVKASATGYNPGTWTSAPVTIARGLAPKATTLPSISGTKRVGYVLTASVGVWTPKPSSYRFTWLADGVVIPSAIGTRLTLTRAHRGKRIAVRVTALRPGHANGVATSARTVSIV